MPRRSRPTRPRGARRRRRPSATSSARTTSSSRCSGTASRTRRSSTAACVPIARDLGLPLVCTNDVHYLQHGDHVPHDVLLCIGTGQGGQRQDRLRYHGDQFYLKTDERDGRRVRRSIPRRCRTRCASPSAATSTSSGTENHLPDFDVPGGLHARRVLRARWSAKGSPSGCRACGSSPAAGALRHRSTSTSRGSRTRSR